MNMVALILFGLVNGLMVLRHLKTRGRMYEFPFWAGALALGWFFPQAIGGCLNAVDYPEQAFSSGMLFATLCTLALWIGHEQAVNRRPSKRSWLELQFECRKLVWAGMVLCVLGFYFQWKLTSLPEEMLSETQWSGAPVKYLFLSSIFIFGFIILWLVYLSRPKFMALRLLVFIVPSLLLLFDLAVFHGRRAAMMNLVAYIFVSLWFVRRIALPRWALVGGLVMGLILVNSIGIYRIALKIEGEESWPSRINKAARIQRSIDKGRKEINNYIYLRQAVADEGQFDLGLKHWNGLVFNYVPAQLVGRGVKDALMLPLKDNSASIARERYGHAVGTGSTVTGYLDAFASFSWFGWIKFWVIGWMMGVLYRQAMAHCFLGQLLYVYMLTAAMHAISHGTHMILFSQWVYFFVLGYPVIRWAGFRAREGEDAACPA